MQATLPVMANYAERQDDFEALFAREYRGVVHAAARIAGRLPAEDLAQEAFAALYRAGPVDSRHARNWLYRTVLNRAISAARAQQRHRERDGRLETHEDAQAPGEALERHETQVFVQSVLRRINPRYAKVIALRYGGLSYKEIAGILNVRTNQIGVLLVRAEAAFKKEHDRAASSLR